MKGGREGGREGGRAKAGHSRMAGKGQGEDGETAQDASPPPKGDIRPPDSTGEVCI